MNAAHEYDDLDEVMAVIESCAEQACAENPGVGMEDAVHDIALSMTYCCTPSVAAEVRRAYGMDPQDAVQSWV